MIGVLDYGMGNLKSVSQAIDAIGYDVEIVTSPDTIDACSHLIIPGVGAFHQAIINLQHQGLFEPLISFAESKKPMLGICLGMQILASMGFENGESHGLDLIGGQVKALNLPVDYKTPHIGWNCIHSARNHPVLFGIQPNIDFYFVHSYYFVPAFQNTVVATTYYGIHFPVCVGKKNIFGVQFHPEKSQDSGLRLLENFCEWDGQC